MKSTLILLLFIGCAAFTSRYDDPSFSNRITIQTDDNPMTALDKLRQLFLSQGYDTEHEFESAPFLLIATRITRRPLGDSSPDTFLVKFTASVDKSDSGSVVTLKGLYVPDSRGFSQTGDSTVIAQSRTLFFASAQEVEMAGDEASAMRNSWNLMTALASKYGSTRVHYQRSAR